MHGSLIDWFLTILSKINFLPQGKIITTKLD